MASSLRWSCVWALCAACGSSSIGRVELDARGFMNDAASVSDASDAGASDASDVGDAATLAPDVQYAPVVSDPDCVHPEVTASCTAGFCRIPAGCFVMGSPEEEWTHPAYAEEQRKVTLTRAFEMQQYEVTQREWSALGLPNPSGRFADGTGDCAAPDCPVGNVTWNEAIAYANLLSEKHEPPLKPYYELSNCQGELGRGLACSGFALTAPKPYDCEGYRLPTDAEREYAARAARAPRSIRGTSRRAPLRTASRTRCSTRSPGTAPTREMRHIRWASCSPMAGGSTTWQATPSSG